MNVVSILGHRTGTPTPFEEYAANDVHEIAQRVQLSMSGTDSPRRVAWGREAVKARDVKGNFTGVIHQNPVFDQWLERVGPGERPDETGWPGMGAIQSYFALMRNEFDILN